ncbi:MAG: hypothetical protein ACTHMM_25325 [Agriterribacter sp.]
MKKLKLKLQNFEGRNAFKGAIKIGDGGSSGSGCRVDIFYSGGTAIGGGYVGDGSIYTNFNSNGKTKDDAIAAMNNFNNDPDSIYNGDYARYCCDSFGNYHHLFS